MASRLSLLLVGDEPRSLQSLRRLLKDKADVWDVEMAEGSAAALALLEERTFDLVLTESSLAQLGGAALLERVRELDASTARLLIVEANELEATVRAAVVAHQVLARSTLATGLVSSIERCLDIRALLADVRSRCLTADFEHLPTAPTTFLALREAARDSEVSLSEIATIIERDVGLSAKILQLANSSLFTLSQEATTIHQAASHLGLDMLRSVCLSSEMFTMFQGKLPEGFSFEEQQRHANRLSQLLVRIVADERVRERAVLAAFLHDVGTLVELTQLPDEFLRIQCMDVHAKMRLPDIERRVLGVSHAEIGACLLNQWGMPFDIVEAVAFHHDPSRSASTEMGILGWVHVADTLIEELDGVPLGGKTSQLDGAFLRRVGVEPSEVQEWRRLAAGLDDVEHAA